MTGMASATATLSAPHFRSCYVDTSRQIHRLHRLSPPGDKAFTSLLIYILPTQETRAMLKGIRRLPAPHQSSFEPAFLSVTNRKRFRRSNARPVLSRR